MESINFNEYTKKERSEIISAFLKKTATDGATAASAERFFEFYFEKFYKIPPQVRNDIIYCQRAMKTHLQVHQLVVQVFAQQPDADPVQKDTFLQEIEDQLDEINAECNYLTLQLKDDIAEFCLVFKEHGVDCNQIVINTVISGKIVPHVCNTDTKVLPINVLPRETDKEMMSRFFTVSEDNVADISAKKTASHPYLIDTVDITEDNDGQDIEKPKPIKTEPKKQLKATAVAPTQQSLSSNVRGKSVHTSTSENPTAAKNEKRATVASASSRRKKLIPTSDQKQKEQSATTTINVDQVQASRLNLIQVLKRTRNERLKVSTGPGVKLVAQGQQLTQKQLRQNQTKQISSTVVPKVEEVKTLENDKNMFLYSMGLCTSAEYKRLLTAQTQLKLRSCNKARQ